RRQLRDQIERELPAEARRVYLLNRQDVLARTIADDYAEYEIIERELGMRTSTSTSLDARVRAVVQASIVPAQQTRRRRELRIYALLILLVAISFLPLSLGNVTGYAFATTASPTEYSLGALLTAVPIVIGISAVVGIVIVNLLPRSLKSRIAAVRFRR